jgi:hypothetical protein
MSNFCHDSPLMEDNVDGLQIMHFGSINENINIATQVMA